MRKKENETTVIVVRDGVPKEVELPEDVMEVLENAYDDTKIVGISRKTYLEMAQLLAGKTAEYKRNMIYFRGEIDTNVYRRTIAFCKAFGIDTNDQALMDALMWVDRSEQQRKNFSSKDISCKKLADASRGSYYGTSYAAMAKVFKEWAGDLFKVAGLHVGCVKLCKFYYSVITNVV